ncbi:OTU deubiquitinase 6A [Rhinolophus ferrumequinum]|uniref:ubiquitinyl hydrolase 1 n=1 Tax=Rhinolophus ferrumequinum TaxID=59479 RepID=A0A671DHU6_RHIFE|nr:OTU domain-containing protein 6A [Rhinolophus ferrumequinum]KAF6390584.1 OTU deubiquitinase 6A [Rhinolophus ferrumequinum]
MEEAQNEYQRMLRRHQREKRELQAHIMAMKSAVPKTDRKKRRQLLLEVARLEAELEQKQKQELEDFRSAFPENSGLGSVTEDLAKMDLENQHPRFLRAQKRRERKAALEREREERLTEAQVEQLTSYQRDEEKRLAVILEARNLEIKEIQADGHCMYRAILDQVTAFESVENLRARTAEYMRLHVDEFLPFFSESETGEAYTRDDFLRYCDKVVCSASWGSQVELRALSHILQSPIEVIQADAPILIIGEEYTRKPITLVYMHYACDLGEHYNSVKPLEAGAVGGAPASLF